MREGGLANWALTHGPPAARRCSRCRTIRSSCRTSTCRPRTRHHDRRRGARHHPRPRARRPALQRVPPPDRPAPADELRRLHRPAPAGRTRRSAQRAAASWSQHLREVYGQHRCDASKPITDGAAQRGRQRRSTTASAIRTAAWSTTSRTSTSWSDSSPRSTRPHGFAISETQFHIFILNASRRLFSDRFFTSSFRPEFYTQLGFDWVTNNGPASKYGGRRCRTATQEVLPLKRVLLRAIPELAPELRARRQRVRSVGARSRRLLFARLEGAEGCGERSGVPVAPRWRRADQSSACPGEVAAA